MAIQPLIVGSGNAGKAMAKSIGVIQAIHPEICVNQAKFLKRGVPLSSQLAGVESPLLMVANPHALHADVMTEGELAGCRYFVCEKPAAVNLKQIMNLRKLQAQVAVCHVYRQMWGPQKLKKMIEAGEFGTLITIEGRYWQSSSAKRFLDPSLRVESWKNDRLLSGDHDTLLDIAPHWIDVVSCLVGDRLKKIFGWQSFENSERPHRDTHVQLRLEFDQAVVAMGSISKTVHGSTNHFEINVLGSRKSATWIFEMPDEIVVGEGGLKTHLYRDKSDTGLCQSPFHSAGWLEGYVEIIYQTLLMMSHKNHDAIPKLEEHLDILEAILKIEKWN